ncbi:MAG: tRNA uridine-5-carboxymethylaminomethyl(34) synthesis GTPase MnmE [Alphaproteobacteria bacterium 64-11]|nr:tRNA uridine-5-carboxymethylaminomethyl(34) synthesis GTPase MnmE [Alphaproteobacteria bacterium]OJU09075.1 MAG: tRNA uridine-5-carboxymethylaminomethyl(34) synthesis GTPase MnmE [Alphaproteobacteria bacterium 64-11]
MNSTIYALSSAPGRAGVAVVRVSGPDAGHALMALAGPLPAPRRAVLRRLAWQGGEIDQALVLWFAAPASFTGEDCAEFHIHGGRAVREALFKSFERLGFKPAEPGEFSRRAVENGKLDLTRAEAIADLVDAETESQRRQALRQHNGALADLYEGWRAALIAALGRAEAAIDFSDDGVGEAEFAAARAAAQEILEQIQEHMADHGRGESLREGLRLTIIGPPNAGKSSLINALARRDVAIVTDVPGTTRDVVEARLDLGGYLLLVADTAGVRQTEDVIEAEGVRRALAHAAGGMTLLLLDGSLPDPRAGLPPDLPEPDLTVWNKADLGFRREGLSISLKTGEGVSMLQDLLQQKVQQKLEGEAPALTRPRHRAGLMEAAEALRHGLAAPAERPELLAEDLRLAMRAIGRITGRVDVEEVLDFIFRDFCIGK